MRYDWISFTTDYGLRDGFVAACHGIIARIAPEARVLDVTHLVAPQDVRAGAAVLAQTAPYLPAAVHLAVVDPGVGTSRHAVAVITDGAALVGPDNGLLLPAARALGGVRSAYRLEAPEYRLSTVSTTFHGRDIFAPAAAHLALGLAPHRLGPALDPGELVALPASHVEVGPGRIYSEALTVDHFGNIQLAAQAGALAEAGLTAGTPVTIDGSHQATVCETFADAGPGELLVLADSAGHTAIAVNGGSAAETLGAGEVFEISARRAAR